MTTAHKWTAVLAAVLLVVAVVLGYAFVEQHTANAVLAAQKADKAESDAGIRKAEDANQQQLKDAIAQLMAVKTAAVTPQQVQRALPTVINVPQPTVLVTQKQADALNAMASPDAPKVNAGDALLTAPDLKAVFDAGVDGKVCAAQLMSCRETVTHDEELLANDAKLIQQQATALKGGTWWHRVKAALAWAGIGAAAAGLVLLRFVGL